MLRNDLEDGAAAEGAPPGQHLVEDDAKAVDIAAGAHGSALRLLRRQVVRRAEDLAVQCLSSAIEALGDTEVRQHKDTFLPQHQVRRLDVAVDDAAAVNLREAARCL